MKRLAFLWAVLALLAGCGVTRPGTVVVPDIKRDTVYQVREIHDTLREVRAYRDTVIQRDSVFVKGETVYREKYIYKTRTAHDTVQVYHYLRDTLFIHQRDSVGVPVYIDRVEKVKYTPWFTRTMAGIGGVCCIAAILWLLFLFVKRKF